MKIRIADIIEESIVDGPGIRFVVFTQGCPHHCNGCHNPQTHDFNGGKLIEINDIIAKMKKYPFISGMTISGGEPFSQEKEVLELVKLFKEKFSLKNIAIYTGFTIEELLKKNNENVKEILENTDYLVDGRFILEQRDISLLYRGSRNQRVINAKKTLENNKIVIWNFDVDI